MSEISRCEALPARHTAALGQRSHATASTDGPVVHSPAPADAGDDAAWVLIPTALAPDVVLRLLDDPERILRINPHWNFETWERNAGDVFQLRVRDTSSGRNWSTSGRIERCDDGLWLVYAAGIKASTRFRVEADGTGSRLWVIDDYGRLPPKQRTARLDEVDRTLPAWGEALHRYLTGWERWGRWPPWRWYMERVWQPMSPLARRIARLLIWVSLFELAVFLLLVGVLALERGR